MLGVAVSWSTRIDNNPSAGAKVVTVILPNAEQATLDAMSTALQRGGLEIGNLAYGFLLQKTGMTSSGPTTVTMTVPEDWVTMNGGKDSIRIVSIADDGTAEVLHTWFDGYDTYSGHMVFKATAPYSGLGTSYWLISVKPYVPAPSVTPVPEPTPVAGQMAPPQVPAGSATTKTTTTTTGLWPVMGVGGALAAMALVGIALLIVIRRRKE